VGARQKLNSSYFCGSLLLASVIGLLLQSWLVLLFALVVFVAVNLNNGDIRPDKR
jgi:type IV secretory pathway TrbD component